MSLARITRAAGVVALLALGALAIHELRYLVASGGPGGAGLESPDHGYLEVLAPVLVMAAAAALVVSVVGPALLRLAPSLDRGQCATERAAGYAAALLAVHFAQELAEGALTAGHSAGIASVLGAGGWMVLPLAMAFGGLAAVARGWLRHAERRVAAALARDSLPRAPRRIASPPRTTPRRALSSLGLRFGIARRPPPLAQRA